MWNESLPPAASDSQLFCPLLQQMRKPSNSTKANTGLICIHGLVSGLGILENALILWVVGFRLRRRTVASVWVLNLALSDLLSTLTLPLFTFYLKSSSSWELGNPLCKIQASIFFLNMFVSAFLLATISLDRCFLITKPVWSQNHRSVAGAWKLCGLGWLWAAANTLPYFFFRSVTEKLDGRKLCYHNFALYSSSPESLDGHCKLWEAGTAISKLLLAFLFPLVIIAASYIQISLTLKTRHKQRKNSATRSITGQTDATTQNKKFYVRCLSSRCLPAATSLSTGCNQSSQLSQSFTKMVTFVVAAFVLCWAPYHIFCIIEVAVAYQPRYFRLVEAGLQIATTAAFLNPVLNPILYVFSCPSFCKRIQQSVGSVFDVVLEERGGLLTSRRNSRTPASRQRVGDATAGTLGSRGLVYTLSEGEELKKESLKRQDINST
ncbi:hypothetical protein fugu_008507 [Takifugu bimaculatus]|uniref:G-protein coupled receptors family 1 profile domain-containing protein n=1 Tax=Takifugu bimaculatus TaxID=433685 RepID=A0A4Z2B3Q6_9TELE|nr:hypothetical protein fugu_008507 [Takifugu bimaculatus]